MRVKKLIFLSLLVAVGLVMGLFESMIPIPVAIPGIRLGLSNMVVLITILFFGSKEGIIVASLKSLLLMLVTGAVSSFIFSFSGAVLSAVSMAFANKYLNKYLSPIGISLIGSTFHNTAQIITACFVLKTMHIISYLPLLLIIGIFTGIFVGLTSNYVIKNLNKTFKGAING